jgi:hypothetical protein
VIDGIGLLTDVISVSEISQERRPKPPLWWKSQALAPSTRVE